MQWIADTVHGPLCHPNWHLDGSKRETTEPKATQSKFENILCSVTARIDLNKPLHSYYLPVYINLPNHQILEEEGEEAEDTEVEEVRSAGVKMDEAEDEAVPVKLVQALLDSGCLVGDCISQEGVSSLKARHLIVNIQTTI